MAEFETIRKMNLRLALLVGFTVAANSGVWAQTKAASPAAAPSAPVSTASVSTPVAAPSASQPAAAPVIAVGAGDLLKVSVLGAPESDQEVRVDQNGNASMNYIGAVHVAGLTTTEAQDEVAKKLAAGGFYTQPQVSVFVKEYATQGVSVMGEVMHPGVYPVLGARRLFDVISLAGGTGPKAGRMVSISHREHPESPTSVKMSNDPVESAKSNVEVYPGDTVVVSRAGMVYVVGDVKKPSGVLMDNGNEMTVLQAIAMAEGTNWTARLNKARLIRTTATGRQELPLALGDMLASKTPDLRLQAEDIIFVPNSAAKTAGRRTLEAIVQSATGLAMYGAR